jgi:SAM-dependent methyltransferase
MFNHFRLVAPLYDRVIGPPDPDRLLAALALPAPGRLLDAGGGTGRIAQLLAPHVDQIVIADETAAMLRESHVKGLCCPVVSHVERLPFGDDSFERVLVVDALHHFTHQRQALGELARVLRSGGRLVVEEPDLNRLSVKVVAVAEKLALMRSRFLYPHEIGRELAGLGLRVEIKTDGHTAWVIAEKA